MAWGRACLTAACVATVAIGLAGASAGHTSAGAGPANRSTTLLVRALDDASRQPLMNADVIVVSSGEHRFTSERGETRLSWPTDGRLHLRIRQIGYRFADSVLMRPSDAATTADSVTFALARVAYNLRPVSTTAANHCANDVDPESRLLSASVLEQLRLGAERYVAFRDAYPFRLRVLRRTVKIGIDGKARDTRQGFETAWSDAWGQPYEPDRVVQQHPGGFSVSILFIASLADSTFWNRHCFAVHGMDSRDGVRLLRMEFTPTLDVRTPDWAGNAFVDSATSLLRRVEFRLAGLPEYDYSSPASLVNALQFLFKEWAYKPVGFVSYGGVSGARGVQMTKQLVPALKMMPMMEGVSIPFFTQHIDKESHVFAPGEVQDKAAAAMLDELKWATAMHPMRTA